MALIVCPDCGKSFSERAAACPECGCPTTEIAGQSSNANAGQISIANNAFEDGRYDEAYQLFAQIYTQNQNNPNVLLRLGLATAAKDYFDNGIPNSTKDLISKGLQMAKSDNVAQIAAFVADAQKVVQDTKDAVFEGLSSAIQQTAPMRGVGSMIADALLSPVASANRNLYEDRRTAENNNRILNNAIANKKIIIATLDAFCSFVLNAVVDVLAAQLDNTNPLYTALGTFVVSGEDAKVYEKLSTSSTPQTNVYGLCYGEEKTILEFNDDCCFLHINGKPHASSFAPPKGHLLLTNYKVVYKANKEKCSFEKSLDDLLRVEIGGPGSWKTHIALIFPNDTKVLITPVPAGMQGTFVALVNEELKMPNR